MVHRNHTQANPLNRTLITRALKPLDHQRTANITDDGPRFSDHDLNSPLRTETAALHPAAVLVPIVTHSDGFTVLLTQRAAHLRKHAGQISFPGGRVEAADANPMETALREAQEEIGLAPECVEVAGLLDDYETVTSYLVTPVVAFVTPGFELKLDEFEVADAFEVPLSFVLDEDNQSIQSAMRNGSRRRFYVMQYGPRYIWGATAGMLMSLHRRILAISVNPDHAQILPSL